MARMNWNKNKINRGVYDRETKYTDKHMDKYLHAKDCFQTQKNKLEQYLKTEGNTTENYKYWKEFKKCKEARDRAYHTIKSSRC